MTKVRATPGELMAKLKGDAEVIWASPGHFQAELAAAAKVPVTYQGGSAWHTLQSVILRELKAEANPIKSSVLRQRVLSLANLDPGDARHVNFFAWALAKLVEADRVKTVIVLGPRGGKRKEYSV